MIRTETVLPGLWHEYAAVFPMLQGEALDALREDIREHGVREPIVVHEGKILDGRNRYMCARDLGIEFPVVDYDGDDALAYVISHNLHRRHLTESQRAMVAAKLAKLEHGGDRRSDQGANLHLEKRTTAEAADLLNVSERSVKSARKVRDKGDETLQQAVETGAVTVSAAADVAELPKEEQAVVVAKGEREILDAAKRIRAEKAAKRREERTEKLVELSRENHALPIGKRYPVIYADPPWEYDFSPSNSRAVENHYPTMPIEEILAMPVADIATPDAMLFLWAPPSFIKKGLATLEAWGFELASSMVWDKEKIGTGIYFRQQHEYLLLGKRGQPITPAPGTQPRSVIRSPREGHSEKPAAVYEIIEKMYPGLPRIELFSRGSPEGWDAWGNQAHAA